MTNNSSVSWSIGSDFENRLDRLLKLREVVAPGRVGVFDQAGLGQARLQPCMLLADPMQHASRRGFKNLAILRMPTLFSYMSMAFALIWALKRGGMPVQYRPQSLH